MNPASSSACAWKIFGGYCKKLYPHFRMPFIRIKSSNLFRLKIGIMKDAASRSIANCMLLCGFVFISSCSTYRTYTSLDKALDNPLAVQRLKISNKNLGSLPAEIGRLENLKQLILFRVHIDSLPPEIGQLKELEYLAVTSSRLQKVPAEIGQLKKLTRLSFEYNQLEALPNEIGNLVHLNELKLTNNFLQSLPSSIGNLTSLEFLYLSENRLAALPNEIGELVNLRFFYVGKNALEDLPASMGNLTVLNELDIAKCGPMVRVPEALCNVHSLEILYIDPTLLVPGCLQGRMGHFQIIIR